MKFQHLDKLSKLITEFTVDLMKAANKQPEEGRLGELLQQLVRVTLAAGSSYRWGRRASRKKEFVNRLRVSQAEFAEVIVWLKMLAVECPQPIWNEALATAERVYDILTASLAKARQPQAEDSQDE